MQKSQLLSLLFCVCILILGCKTHRIDSPSKIPQASKTFAIAQAMTMFYGNFDLNTQTSTVTFSKTDSVRIYGEPMIVRPLFQTFGSDAAAPTFVVLTYAVPKRDEAYYCHACAPTLGMAVFTKQGSDWTLTASNRAVADAGGYGKPPKNVELIKIGANRQAVQITDTEEGGERTTVLLIFAAWKDTVGLALERIIGDDDRGMCGPKGLPCYSNYRTFTFSRNPKSDYFDLELRLTGTDLPVSNSPRVWKARKVSGVEVLRFENGKYIQISRSGNLNMVDRVVAERERLK